MDVIAALVFGFAWQAGLGALVGLLLAWVTCTYLPIGPNCSAFGSWMVGGGCIVGVTFAIVNLTKKKD